MTFIARPSKVLEQYIRSAGTPPDGLSWHLGRMSMALEIITQIKTLEELRAIATDVGRAEAVTALETLLQDCGLRDVAYEMYDKLSEWRKPKFRPVIASQHEHELQGNAVAVGPGGPHPLAYLTELSSGDASPREDSPQGSKPHASPEEHRDREQDLWPTSLRGEGPSGEALRKRIGSHRPQPDKASSSES